MEQQKKVINGTTYFVNQMPGTKALRAQTVLVSLLGKGIFEVLANKDLLKNDDEIIGALAPLLDGFDNTKADAFVLSLFDEGVFVEKKTEEGSKVTLPIDFDEDFKGKATDIWKVVGFILKANFSTGKSTGSSSLTTVQEKEKPGS